MKPAAGDKQQQQQQQLMSLAEVEYHHYWIRQDIKWAGFKYTRVQPDWYFLPPPPLFITYMPTTTTVSPSTTVQVHPLVLLSATDHYNRVAKDTKKRVVGVLLGQNKGKTVNVSNSFAGTHWHSSSPVSHFTHATTSLIVPFEEDEKDPSVWFLDHNYIEGMNNMFKKVNGTSACCIKRYLTYPIYNSQRKVDRLVS